MKRLLRAFSTTVGMKFVMAITGLMLSGFLVAHLAGNLLLYVGDKAYSEYAQKLHSQEGLLKVAEVGLATVFLLHISLAFRLARANRSARDTQYAVRTSKIKDRLSILKPETFMLASGVVILVFLILHLIDFTFLLRPDIDYSKYTGEYAEAEKARALLSTPLTGFVYAIGTTLLGVHLGHGFSSAFQSLGLNHPKYERVIHWVGVIFAIVIGVGFFSFPVVYQLAS